MDIAFISCVSKKLNHSAKAKDLYISDLFKKSLKYCQVNYDKIFILSAKYGLLELDDQIDTYDMTLNNMNEKQKKQWSYKVYHQIIKKIDEDDVLYFHCGLNYRKYLIRKLKNDLKEPMKGISIGLQLRFYKLNT